jgi:hypothetical protein
MKSNPCGRLVPLLVTGCLASTALGQSVKVVVSSKKACKNPE